MTWKQRVRYLETGDVITRIQGSFYRVDTPEGNRYWYDKATKECSCPGYFYTGHCRHLRLPRLAAAFKTATGYTWMCPRCGRPMNSKKRHHWRTGLKRCPSCGQRILISVRKT